MARDIIRIGPKGGKIVGEHGDKKEYADHADPTMYAVTERDGHFGSHRTIYSVHGAPEHAHKAAKGHEWAQVVEAPYGTKKGEKWHSTRDVKAVEKV